LRESPDRAAEGAFYTGLAHGVRARLYTLRAQALKSGSEGKRMRAALVEAMEADPELAPDSLMGLGVYNYYADVLSPLVKLFRFFLRIPGGDREKGLKQLQTASQEARLLAPEARYGLARILGGREGRHTEALALLEGLERQYSANALFSLTAALEAEDAGQRQAAIRHARATIAASAKMDDACREPLQSAGQQALARLEDSLP
jgi:hypothetical protein